MPQFQPIKGMEDFQKMSQVGVETSMKMFSEWTRGWQQIAMEMSDYSKRSIESGTAHFERMMTAKSMEQAVELQTSYAKRSYDDYMAQMAKVNGMYAEFAKEAYKPMERVFQGAR
jgi:hypothetical protein